MKKSLYYLYMAFVAFAFTSCNSKLEIFTPTSSGRPYEVLVVADHNIWNNVTGKALFAVLDSDVPGLPQSESAFRVMYAPPSDFDSTLKLVRNIILVDIQESYTQPAFEFVKDVYAGSQMILKIQAPSEEEFAKFVTDNKQPIKDFFTHVEMNRQILLLKDRHNEFISAAVDSMFGCNIWLPIELTSSKIGDNFFWASTNSGTADCNFVIYSYPYVDEQTFTKEYLVHKRDSVMKVNIPGVKEGMYMTTDSLLTDMNLIDVYKDCTMESRGLWYMKNDCMGGPYVSLTRLDKQNQRIITAEIFVYSPDKMKCNLVRWMEASLYTLRLPDEIQQENIPLGVTKEKKTK